MDNSTDQAQNQAVSIAEVLAFLSGYAAHKAFQQKSQLPAVLDSMLNFKKAGEVRRCATWFAYKKFQNKMSGEIALKQIAGETCKHKFCPFCQWRLSRKTFVDLLVKIAALKEIYPNIHFGLLTKTYPNPPVDKVRETYKKMSAAECNFFRNSKIKKRFLGAFTAYEYFGDHTKAGEAHLHSHSLVAWISDDLSEIWTRRECREVWESVLDWKNDPLRRGNYPLQVDFQKITEKPQATAVVEIEPDVENNKLNKNFQKVCCGVLEVVKYCTAPQAMEKLNKKDFRRIIFETKGLRKYRTSGVFYKFKFPEGKDENYYKKNVFDDYKDLSDEKIWEFLGFLEVEWRYNEERYYVFGDGRRVVAKIGKDAK